MEAVVRFCNHAMQLAAWQGASLAQPVPVSSRVLVRDWKAAEVDQEVVDLEAEEAVDLRWAVEDWSIH